MAFLSLFVLLDQFKGGQGKEGAILCQQTCHGQIESNESTENSKGTRCFCKTGIGRECTIFEKGSHLQDEKEFKTGKKGNENTRLMCGCQEKQSSENDKGYQKIGGKEKIGKKKSQQKSQRKRLAKKLFTMTTLHTHCSSTGPEWKHIPLLLALLLHRYLE